jgi:AcrR family transcriptional regulator
LANQTRSDQTRNAIIEAALAVIGRDGASRLTFATVARECGISKGAVTHHFSSKADLLAGILQYRNTAFDEFRRNYVASQQPGDSQKALSLEIATVRHLVDQGGSPARAVLSILVDDPSPMETVQQNLARSLRQIRDEAPDPQLAVLRWEAAWGLALYAVFGMSPLTDEGRERLFNRLLDDKQWTRFEQVTGGE